MYIRFTVHLGKQPQDASGKGFQLGICEDRSSLHSIQTNSPLRSLKILVPKNNVPKLKTTLVIFEDSGGSK